MLSQGRDVRKQLDEEAIAIMVLNPYLCLRHITLQAGLKGIISPVLEGSYFLELCFTKKNQIYSEKIKASSFNCSKHPTLNENQTE